MAMAIVFTELLIVNTFIRGILTIMMTIVLCPSEKKRPHVTDNCPSPIRPRVALSIALFTGGQFCGNKKDYCKIGLLMQNIQLEDWQRTLVLPDVICIQGFEFHWNIISLIPLFGDIRLTMPKTQSLAKRGYYRRYSEQR